MACEELFLQQKVNALLSADCIGRDDCVFIYRKSQEDRLGNENARNSIIQKVHSLAETREH